MGWWGGCLPPPPDMRWVEYMKTYRDDVVEEVVEGVVPGRDDAQHAEGAVLHVGRFVHLWWWLAAVAGGVWWRCTESREVNNSSNQGQAGRQTPTAPTHPPSWARACGTPAAATSPPAR